MKATGIVRKIDSLSRIVIPMELRKTFDIKNGDPYEIFAEDDRILLKKFEISCIFCGDGENLNSFKGKNICDICKTEIKNKMGNS